MKFSSQILMYFFVFSFSQSLVVRADVLQQDNLEVAQIKDVLVDQERESQVCKPFDISYAHKTEIVLGSHLSLSLPDEVEAHAKSLYSYLNDSKMFKTTFVRDVAAVRKHHIDPNNPDRGELIKVGTQDGVDIFCTYFDRGGDELVIVGAGFTNEREIMTPFVEMFRKGAEGKPARDVVLMDFRGHGYEPTELCNPSTWMTCNIAKNTFGMDSRFSRLGEIEELDVLAVVNNFRAFKNYKKVYGVSVCYGSFIFLKAEGMYPGLFDKIVVDGCWDTLKKVVDKLQGDLKLLCKPQTGGWKDVWLLQQSWAKKMLLWTARNVWDLNFEHDVCLSDYLPKIKNTPVLFFYGKNDLMVYRDEFEDLYGSLASPFKAAVVTSNPHVMNQYKQKELYKHVCEKFFESSSLQDFANGVFGEVSPDNVLDYKIVQ